MFIVRNKQILQFFSVAALLKTLFAPFRQDSVDTKGSPVSEKLQAIGGNIISRFFGLMVRLVLIICGVALVICNTVVGCICIVIWPLLPFAPLVTGLIALFLVGFINV